MQDISIEEAKDLIDKFKDLKIIDVRTKEEFDMGHIKNSINIDFYDYGFNSLLQKLDKGEQYLLYCRTGGRSATALSLMINMGFQNVFNMEGGIMEWVRMQNPIE